MRIRFAKLRDVLPPEHPLSSSLFRLLVLREELVFEFEGIRADDLGSLDRGDKTCRRVFFFRRNIHSLVALAEVLREPTFNRALKDLPVSGRRREIRDGVAKTLRMLRRETEGLQVLRNQAVAHLDHGRHQRVLEQESNFRYAVQLGDESLTTFFRLPYIASFATLLDPLSTPDEFEQMKDDLVELSARLTAKALQSVDAIAANLLREVGYWR